MLVIGPDGGALIPRMFCGGKTMDTEERRAWKLLFEKVNAMNDDPLKRTPACELDRDNKVNAMDDTQRRACSSPWTIFVRPHRPAGTSA